MPLLDVAYYYVTQADPMRAVCRLLEKICEARRPACCFCRDDVHMRALDDLLWQYGRGTFLPHGTMADPFPDQQPILLMYESVPPANHAEILVTIYHPLLPSYMGFTRAIHLLLQDESTNMRHVAMLMEHYRQRRATMTLKEITHWVQKPDGAWQRFVPPADRL